MLVGAYLPRSESGRWVPATIATLLARKSARYPHQSIHPVFDNPHFAMTLVVADQRSVRENLVAAADDSTRSSWVYFHRIAPEDRGAVATALGTQPWDTVPLIPGQWIAAQWDESEGILRIATDRLGNCMLFVAPYRGGVVFSTDFGAVAEICDGPLRLDQDSVLLQFAYGYAPDDSTVYDSISVLPPRALLELRSATMMRVSQGSFCYGDAFFGATDEHKFAILDDLFAEMSKRWFGDGMDLVLSLSAGYDSRYALALLHARGSVPGLFTFGSPDSTEVIDAKRVARRIGATTEVFEMSESRWEAWERCTLQLGSTAMNQWAGWGEDWLQLLRHRAPAVAIGYLGDALSGKHLGTHPERAADWVGHWIDWSTDRPRLLTGLLTEHAVHRLAALARERFSALASGITVAHPYQTLLHLDLFGRQRRWVSNQPNLIQRFLAPLTYFSDDRFVEFWCNLPLRDVASQRLYLDYASKRFSALFPPGENQGGLAKLVARVVRKAKSAFGTPPTRPHVIDHLRIVLQNRERILDIAAKAPPELSEVIAMERFVAMVKNYGSPGTVSQLNSHAIISVASLLQLVTPDRDKRIGS